MDRAPGDFSVSSEDKISRYRSFSNESNEPRSNREEEVIIIKTQYSRYHHVQKPSLPNLSIEVFDDDANKTCIEYDASSLFTDSNHNSKGRQIEIGIDYFALEACFRYQETVLTAGLFRGRSFNPSQLTPSNFRRLK